MNGDNLVQKILVEKIIKQKIQEIRQLEDERLNSDHAAFLHRVAPLLDVLQKIQMLDTFSITVNITKTETI